MDRTMIQEGSKEGRPAKELQFQLGAFSSQQPLGSR
jgi:hypothetical protein